jgi:ABC-type multidrug transport system ATPase subunit
VSQTGPVAVLERVGKRYGQRWAIRNIDLTLSPGEVVGFIGPNGAGKTTLLRLMASLSPVSEGRLTLLGERLDGRAPRTPFGVGVMLEQMGFVPHLSGRANLDLLAGLRRVAGPEAIERTLAQVGLDPLDRRPVKTYSLGMRQRLALAQALMERPRLLLLDEPSNGLDPGGIVTLRETLERTAREGTAILLASHLLTEVERVCTRVLFVRDGELLKQIDLRSRQQARVRLVVSTAADAVKVVASGIRAEQRTDERGRVVLLFAQARTIPELIPELVRADVSIEEVGCERPALEEEFLNLFSQADGVG